MIEIIYILCLIIIIRSEVWTITYCLGLGNETQLVQWLPMTCTAFTSPDNKEFDIGNEWHVTPEAQNGGIATTSTIAQGKIISNTNTNL